LEAALEGQPAQDSGDGDPAKRSRPRRLHCKDEAEREEGR